MKEFLPVPQATQKGYIECYKGGCFDSSYPTSLLRRGRVQEGGAVTPALTAQGCEYIKYIEDSMRTRPEGKGWIYNPKVDRWFRVRTLTPRECFRLMDVSEEDIDKIQATGLSNTQQYKMAGNSIVVAVLYHLFRQAFAPDEAKDAIIEGDQLNLFG